MGEYDRNLPLILDPAVLIYCGYIGGSSGERGEAIAVDSAGSVYITGWAESSQSSFPVTVRPDLSGNGGDSDAFVAKVNSAGTGLVYCGYIGGADWDFGHAIAVDNYRNTYITGTTASTQAQNFPVTVGPDLTYNGGDYDAFVAKIYCTPPIKNDFNSDGQEDILWRNYGTGGNALWYMGSSGGSLGLSQGIFEILSMDKGPEQAQIYQDVWEAGEILNNDERVYHDVLEVDVPQKKIVEKVYRDVLEAEEVLNKPKEEGIVGDVQELMSPGNLKAGAQAISIIGTAYLTTITNVNWQIGGSGDFNGDGNVDILWRHYGTGANVLWYMNRSTIMGTEYLITIADVNWRIQNH